MFKWNTGWLAYSTDCFINALTFDPLQSENEQSLGHSFISGLPLCFWYAITIEYSKETNNNVIFYYLTHEILMLHFEHSQSTWHNKSQKRNHLYLHPASVAHQHQLSCWEVSSCRLPCICGRCPCVPWSHSRWTCYAGVALSPPWWRCKQSATWGKQTAIKVWFHYKRVNFL